MHDPMTVAFEIKSPLPGKPILGGYRYREPWLTVWHVDPEKGGHGGRSDDSCGWFRPPTTKAEREAMSKLAKQQYGQIFEKQARTAEGASYAYICFEPNAYDAVYWCWRAIKFADRKGGWQYGDGPNRLTRSELEAIYLLSANPVDNIRSTVAGVKNEDDFEGLFFIVWGAYRRHHRPWYRHPRWHVWHWKIQWHWLQNFNRWAFHRCDHCGGRFAWRESVHGNWGGDKIWHSRCDNSIAGQAAPTPHAHDHATVQ